MIGDTRSDADAVDIADEVAHDVDPAESGHRAASAIISSKGLYLTPRQTFFALAIALTVVLAVLLGYLLWVSRPVGFVQRGGAAKPGIEPVFSVYGPGRGAAPRFDSPMGVAWGKDNRIYVADSANNRVVVFDNDGDFVREFGGFGIAKPLRGSKATWKPGALNYPTDVAVDSKSGDVYVADFYNDSISVFTAEGSFLRRFPDPVKPVGKGSSGAGGGGIAVTAVAVADGKVYATDTYQVLVFDLKGKLLRQFGMPGLDPGQLDHPNGVAVDSRGRIYVSDSNHNRVTAFSPEGKPLWTTGSKVSDLQKETDNPFMLPRGMSITNEGAILVADPIGQALVKMSEDGKVLADYGARGSSPGEFDFPNDVSIRSDLLLVADRENNRIQVIRLNDR